MTFIELDVDKYWRVTISYWRGVNKTTTTSISLTTTSLTPTNKRRKPSPAPIFSRSFPTHFPFWNIKQKVVDVGNSFLSPILLLFQVSQDILQVILQVMASSSSSSSSSSSIPVDLESCEQEIANIRRAIQSCAQEISSDLSEPTKARIIGCVSMLARQFEQDFAIQSIRDTFN